MNDQIKPVQPNEVRNPNLSPMESAAMLLAMNSTLMGVGDVHVSVTYPKQTSTKARVPDKDFVSLPGVSPETLIGKLMVARRVDNAANRKAGVVGKVYCKVESVTRANGQSPYGYANVRPESVTAFVVTGFVPHPETPEAPTPQQGG